MAYTVYLGTLNKRLNSTKRPTQAEYEAWDTYTVTLKEVTSYDRPTLLLSAEFASVANKHYNYAIMFGRWYWVTDLRAVRTNQIEIDLTLDILATFQGDIRNTQAFIEYGANTFDAGASGYRIADSRRPIGKNPTAYTVSADITGGVMDQYGVYIMQVVNGDDGVLCFAVAGGQLRAIMNTLNISLTGDLSSIETNIDYTDTAANTAVLAELLGYNLKNSLLAETAADAIKSIHWLPLNYTAISGTSTLIKLGQFSTGQYGKLLTTNPLWTYSGTLTIPWPVSDWRRNNVQMSLYIPFFGTVPVPIDQCINNSTIAFTLSMDILSGDLSIRIVSGSQTIYTGSTNVSAPYAFGTAQVSARANLSGGIQAVGGVMQMATGAIDAGAGIVGAAFGLGGGLSGGVSNILSGAQNTISGYAQSVQPVITSAGSMGGIAALGQNTNIILTLLYYAPLTDTNFDSLYGHPVYMVDTPALGFCKTRGFSISLGNEAAYAAYINTVMDNGVFIEE